MAALCFGTWISCLPTCFNRHTIVLCVLCQKFILSVYSMNSSGTYEMEFGLPTQSAVNFPPPNVQICIKGTWNLWANLRKHSLTKASTITTSKCRSVEWISYWKFSCCSTWWHRDLPTNHNMNVKSKGLSDCRSNILAGTVRTKILEY
jgi:hypothetical protein